MVKERRCTMDKTYKVIYKTGRSQIVTGTIAFFNNIDAGIPPRLDNAIYLNADMVMSVIEQPIKTSEEF
jgi:hypothetical protein